MEVEPTFAVSPSSTPAERPSSKPQTSTSQNRNRTIIIVVVCIIIAICVALVLGFVFIDQLRRRDGDQPKPSTPVIQPAAAKPVDNTENLERIRLLEEQEEQLLNEIEAEKRMEEEEASDKLLETARTMGVLPPKVQHGKVPVFTQNEFTAPPPRQSSNVSAPQQRASPPQQNVSAPQQNVSAPQQNFAPPPTVDPPRAGIPIASETFVSIPIAPDSFAGDSSLNFSFSFIPEPERMPRSWSDDEEDSKIVELEEKNEPTTESDED